MGEKRRDEKEGLDEDGGLGVDMSSGGEAFTVNERGSVESLC